MNHRPFPASTLTTPKNAISPAAQSAWRLAGGEPAGQRRACIRASERPSASRQCQHVGAHPGNRQKKRGIHVAQHIQRGGREGAWLGVPHPDAPQHVPLPRHLQGTGRSEPAAEWGGAAAAPSRAGGQRNTWAGALRWEAARRDPTAPGWAHRGGRGSCKRGVAPRAVGPQRRAAPGGRPRRPECRAVQPQTGSPAPECPAAHLHNTGQGREGPSS